MSFDLVGVVTDQMPVPSSPCRRRVFKGTDSKRGCLQQARHLQHVDFVEAVRVGVGNGDGTEHVPGVQGRSGRNPLEGKGWKPARSPRHVDTRVTLATPDV